MQWFDDMVLEHLANLANISQMRHEAIRDQTGLDDILEDAKCLFGLPQLNRVKELFGRDVIRVDSHIRIDRARVFNADAQLDFEKHDAK